MVPKVTMFEHQSQASTKNTPAQVIGPADTVVATPEIELDRAQARKHPTTTREAPTTIIESTHTDQHGHALDASPTVIPAHTTSNACTTEGPASCAIKMAFVEDARLHGVHPANLNAEKSAKLDHMMPHGFRYARELQEELVFIPPLNHARAVLGSDFVIQKKGNRALVITKPLAVVNIGMPQKPSGNKTTTKTAEEAEATKENLRPNKDLVTNRNNEATNATVDSLSERQPMSPASRVIAAINANPPGQQQDSAGLMQHRFHHSHAPHDWQNDRHGSHYPNGNVVGRPPFSPSAYFAVPQGFGAFDLSPSPRGDARYHVYPASSAWSPYMVPDRRWY